MSRRQRTYDSFIFSCLQGATEAGKDADVYVLVGYDGDLLRDFVIPSAKIGQRRDLEINVNESKYMKGFRWMDMEVNEADLSAAILDRASA